MPFDPLLTPDGSRVVYRAIQDNPWTWELHAGATDGAANVKINAPLPADGNVGSFRLTPDGSSALYVVGHADGTYGLFASPLDGGGAVMISPPWRDRYRGDHGSQQGG